MLVSSKMNEYQLGSYLAARQLGSLATLTAWLLGSSYYCISTAWQLGIFKNRQLDKSAARHWHIDKLGKGASGYQAKQCLKA
jgi:hypothetical protein